MKPSNETYWSLPFLLGCVSLSVAIHWLIVNFIGSMWTRRLRHKLKGKVVLITGGSSGLGEALAHSFYKAGCRVILAARRTEELERVKKDLVALHKEGLTHTPEILQLDLADLESLPDRASQALELFGQIDILINNGGISNRGNVQSTNANVFIKIMTVNFFGQMVLTKALLPSMIRQQSGHIVAVSSVQGKMAIPFRSAYAASKHALQAFSDSLRAEVAQHNIQVSVVSPGYIATALSINALTGSGSTHGVMDSAIASGYTPEYVAEEILKAVIRDKKDIIIAPIVPRIAVLLREPCSMSLFQSHGKKSSQTGGC
ncbi:hypothetical protein L9F63_018473 [Diploptera punctata]|uniref:Ketoreductase domain-containing protein n=1 Tax=Diploptera punctata TaxID=6984 RepID=A0AAD8EF71_DIPPU|nr:hypothetical protein L9F63_018473 [Diploptera punctata]